MKSNQPKILAVIPARGGSKGIPKKNIRLMAGKPLISYSIETALSSRYDIDVVVSTDDEQISLISEMYGADTIIRPDELAQDNVTLDPVIFHALTTVEQKNHISYDVVITMQPTSPLLTANTFDSAIDYFLTGNYDTVLSCINHPHLAWGYENDKIVPLYKERLNRQYLPKHFLETGAFFISKRDKVTKETRFGENVSVFELPLNESVDIDYPQDWWVAERHLLKKNIILRPIGYKEVGTGHIQRCLQLAHSFIEHNILFVLDEKSDIAVNKIKESFFPYRVIKNEDEIYDIIDEFSCDILVNDMLNTDEDYIRACKRKGVRVINFEDLGSGAEYADVVINDLYEKNNDLPNFYWGSDYYCIRDEFLLANPSKFNSKVQEILVSFGGTDPNNLTLKVFNCIGKIQKEHDIHFTFILGMGYKNYEQLEAMAAKSNLNVSIIRNVPRMSEYMVKADIAISSQGRTMLELARMAVPTILLAANEREQNHEFGYLDNGFINLGLGNQTKEDTIVETLLWLINCPQIRNQIRNQMLKTDLTLGNERVKSLILNDNRRK